MPRYFFVLGKNPTLSLAEIFSLLSFQKNGYTVLCLSQEVAVLSLEKSLDPQAFMKVLGGTIKLGEIIEEIGLEEDSQRMENVFTADFILKHFLSKQKGKMHIGISLYDGGADRQILSLLAASLKQFNFTIKENAKERGVSVGFLKQKERFLSSVSVFKNKLLSKGAEIVLIASREKVIVGKTLAVQEFASFSFRDWERPYKDKKAGIMPPKLARMMINLAQINKEQTILDPFCGSGTVLQEAVVLGYKHLIGSDISHKAIMETGKNLDWLFYNLRYLNKLSYNIKLVEADVRGLAGKLGSGKIDAIVAETHLGPPFYKKPDLNFIKNITKELGKLYLEAFTQFMSLLKLQSSVVIIFPVFENKGEMYFLEIAEEIKKLGFNKQELIPSYLQNNPAISLTRRGTILYSGKEDFVKREILCFSSKTT